MLASLLRLAAVRPLLTGAILGIPLVILVLVGLVTIFALKFFVFFVLPVLAVIWLIRRFRTQP